MVSPAPAAKVGDTKNGTLATRSPGAKTRTNVQEMVTQKPPALSMRMAVALFVTVVTVLTLSSGTLATNKVMAKATVKETVKQAHGIGAEFGLNETLGGSDTGTTDSGIPDGGTSKWLIQFKVTEKIILALLPYPALKQTTEGS